MLADYFNSDIYTTISGIFDGAVHLKLEGLNPAGSIKLKPALHMISDLEQKGQINRDTVLIESSSGNLGIALSAVCAERGYKFTCVIDPNTSPVSRDIINAFGATTHTVTERDESGGFLHTRIRYIKGVIAREANYHWINQYANPKNWEAHYLSTASEIALKYNNKVDYLFLAPGTTGTLLDAMDADIIVFATNSGFPYVNEIPFKGERKIVLNISLRDITPNVVIDAYNYFDDVDHCLKAQTSIQTIKDKIKVAAAPLLERKTILSDKNFDLDMFDPMQVLLTELPASVTSNNYDTWVCGQIEVDLAKASKGLNHSALKAASEVWRDLRNQLRYIIDYNGLTPQSLKNFYGVWNKVINRLVAGPQKERHMELLALHQSDILTFLHPDQLRTNTMFKIAGRVPTSGLSNPAAHLMQDLWQKGYCVPVNSEAGLDTIAIDKMNHPLDKHGNSLPNLWLFGPSVEGSIYYNHYVATSGIPSRMVMDAHKAVKECLALS